MDIHLTATGTPGNAAQDIAKQIKTQRNDAPDGDETWPVLAPIRDSVVKLAQQKAAEFDERKVKNGEVQIDVDITIRVTEMTAKAAIEAFNSGEPLPVPGEPSSTSKGRRTSETAAAEPATPSK